MQKLKQEIQKSPKKIITRAGPIKASLSKTPEKKPLESLKRKFIEEEKTESKRGIEERKKEGKETVPFKAKQKLVDLTDFFTKKN